MLFRSAGVPVPAEVLRPGALALDMFAVMFGGAISLAPAFIKDILLLGPEALGVLRSGVARIGVISHKKNGTTVVANVNPIFIDGEIAGVVSVIKDITEIQNLMERLTQVSARAEYLEQELLRTKKTASAFGSYIGKSGKVVDVLALASKAAASSATVLIRGESGTGKELVAKAIHEASPRAVNPLVYLNCAAELGVDPTCCVALEDSGGKRCSGGCCAQQHMASGGHGIGFQGSMASSLGSAGLEVLTQS